MTEAKPSSISKHLVMKAFQLVKANHGAAGVDGQSVDAFEEDLKGVTWHIILRSRFRLHSVSG